MANWTIKVSEQYFKAYYDEMKKEMMHEKILNVDETPFLVTKAVRLLAELDKSSGIGLIERVKQGQGKPAIIYVKRFTSRKLPEICPADDFRLPETGSPDFPKPEVQTSQNRKPLYIVRIRLIIVIFTHLSINQKNRLMRWIETDAELWSKKISGISHSPSRTVPK